MLCDLCKKNEATIHIQQVAPGEKKVMHICSECASSRFQNSLQASIDPFELAEMFHEILSERMKTQREKQKNDAGDKAVQALSSQLYPPCGGCGWTLEKLQTSRQVGCAGCYDHFRQAIEAALPENHCGIFHKGKIPGAHPAEEECAIAAGCMKLAEAQTALADAVMREDFEKAAELRDAIQFLQKKLDEVNKNTPEGGA